jgi:periplasmic divalent cation tolerance protein
MKPKKTKKVKSAVMGYVTTRNRAEALKIAKRLVGSGLVACANVIPSMSSIYRWEGKVETAAETVLIVKSSQEKVEAITQEIKKLHSYAVPCVVFWKITRGNSDYFKWLKENVF